GSGSGCGYRGTESERRCSANHRAWANRVSIGPKSGETSMPDKREFPHHMIKEIFEQPQGLHDTIAPRISLPEGVVQLNEVPIRGEELRKLSRINIVASGTSRHAGMVGQYMIQDLANIPVDVDYASEFEYRNPMIGQSELTIVITQSGETADTGAAQREAKVRGSR